ncbi:PREDICTED: uncharacterized protein LOC107119813 [Gekko japonicus]|uniref:Uncharacterized protein LOC107119813 n=1 Tax=Gekko japonicus TaxID=146911 RepID=A0ABM1KW03_GEKJA|nr:PREDICTED: uncharacterized protein LOC107119813 [Gekko japonicus]
MLSPAAPPRRKAKAGLRPEAHRCPSLLAAFWVGGGALGLVACLLTVLCLHLHLEALRGELSQLREELRTSQGHQDEGPLQFQGAGDLLTSWALQERPRTPLQRRKRDLAKTSRESTRPRRKQSVLHLVPVRQSSSSDGDMTNIWWKTFLQQGRALELSGQDVIVKHTGLYLIYSQVLFHDHTFTMGQELRRLRPEGEDQTLFRCIQSMPGFTCGQYQLESRISRDFSRGLTWASRSRDTREEARGGDIEIGKPLEESFRFPSSDHARCVSQEERISGKRPLALMLRSAALGGHNSILKNLYPLHWSGKPRSIANRKKGQDRIFCSFLVVAPLPTLVLGCLKHLMLLSTHARSGGLAGTQAEACINTVLAAPLRSRVRGDPKRVA